MEVVTLNREVTCAQCQEIIPAGQEVKYYNKDKIYHSPKCPDKKASAPRPEAGPGVTGLLNHVVEELEAMNGALTAIGASIEKVVLKLPAGK